MRILLPISTLGALLLAPLAPPDCGTFHVEVATPAPLDPLPADGSTPTPDAGTPPTPDAGVDAGPSLPWRPFAATSPVNTPIPTNAKATPDSALVVARMLGFGALQHLTTAGGEPLYWATSTDPLLKLQCLMWTSTCPVQGLQARVPLAAKPEEGSDAHLSVVQPDRTVLEVWQAQPPDAGTLSFSFGSFTRLDGDGLDGLATAGGWSNLAGRIRLEELQAGVIEHALMLVVSCTNGTVVPPTPPQGHPGRTCASMNLPSLNAPAMGARFQLLATEEEIMARPPWERAIWRAFAKYGAFVTDTGGSWALEAEPIPVTYAQANGWTYWAPDNTYVGSMRGAFDWASRLRVVAP
jgi:hypothetical protein